MTQNPGHLDRRVTILLTVTLPPFLSLTESLGQKHFPRFYKAVKSLYMKRNRTESSSCVVNNMKNILSPLKTCCVICSLLIIIKYLDKNEIPYRVHCLYLFKLALPSSRTGIC